MIFFLDHLRIFEAKPISQLECGTGPKSGSRSNFSVGQHNEKILLLDQVNAQWIIIHRTVSNF